MSIYTCFLPPTMSLASRLTKAGTDKVPTQRGCLSDPTRTNVLKHIVLFIVMFPEPSPFDPKGEKEGYTLRASDPASSLS